MQAQQGDGAAAQFELQFVACGTPGGAGQRFEAQPQRQRGLGAFAPYTIGYLATLPRVGIGSALALTSAFFLAGALLSLAFPDRSRDALAG